MLRKSLFVAAAIALSASSMSASAAPFGGSLTANADATPGQSDKRSVFAIVVDHMQFSFAAIRGAVAAESSSGESTEYKSRKTDQCDQTETADEDEENGQANKKAGPHGPEPIYFGF